MSAVEDLKALRAKKTLKLCRSGYDIKALLLMFGYFKYNINRIRSLYWLWLKPILAYISHDN